MKKYLKTLWLHKITVIIILFVSFLSCFVFMDFYNKNNAYYQAEIKIENIEQFNASKLTDENFLNGIKESGFNDKTNKNKYEGIDVNKMLENEDFVYNIENDILIIKTGYKYYETFFLSSENTISNRAKTFVRDCVNALAEECDCEVSFINNKDIVVLNNYLNRWTISLIFALIAFALEIIIFTLIYKFKENWLCVEKTKYDNETIFNNCFHKKYWKEATRPLKKVKDITTIAMLFALLVVAGIITLPSGFGNLGLSLAYLFFAIIAMIYGPVYAFVIGIFSDIIGYFTSSTGAPFNFGYTIQAALCGFIYGVCLYKTKITFTKVLISRTLVNLLMNTVFGSFLFIFVTYFNTGNSFDFASYLEKVKYYMILLSLPKNILYLLPQSMVLYLVLSVASPALSKFKLIDKRLVGDK